jgi:hypothetical protein
MAGATAVATYGLPDIDGQAYAAAGALVSLTDTITITSSGTFHLVEMVNGVSTLAPCGLGVGDSNNAVSASVSLNTNTPAGVFGFDDTGYGCGRGALAPGISDSIGIDLPLVAGQTLSLSATATAAATVIATLANPRVSSIGDVSHSLFFYLTPVTPGASYITATGNDYAQPVPAFTFRGFFSPVDNDPVVNKANAGAGIPVKFSLGGFQGLDIFLAGFPGSQSIACDSFAVIDQVEETISAGQSGLTYDASLDQYTYVWKTDKAWAGTCRQLVLRLSDGTFHIANFQFGK